MRANAPFTAALALATLSLFSAPLYARPYKATPYKQHLVQNTGQTPAPKPAPKTKKPGAKPAPKPKPSHKRHETGDDTSPPTITRIHTRTPAATGTTPRAQVHIAAVTPSHSVILAPNSPKARSTDFLHAASGIPAPVETPSVVDVVRSTSSEAQASDAPFDDPSVPVILPSLYNERGRLVVPRALRGSRQILLHQNEVADNEGLDRLRDDDDILDLRSQNLLVPIPTGPMLIVNDRLPDDRRYCRPWTARFLTTMANAYYAHFHTPLQINSAVRTVQVQRHLLRINGNAAPIEGDTASPHLTGQAIDLAKHGLTLTQIAWLRGYLMPLVQQGKIDVEEEFKQACFHISVYKKYLPPDSSPRRSVATTHHSETTSLATAVN